MSAASFDHFGHVGSRARKHDGVGVVSLDRERVVQECVAPGLEGLAFLPRLAERLRGRRVAGVHPVQAAGCGEGAGEEVEEREEDESE